MDVSGKYILILLKHCLSRPEIPNKISFSRMEPSGFATVLPQYVSAYLDPIFKELELNAKKWRVHRITSYHQKGSTNLSEIRDHVSSSEQTLRRFRVKASPAAFMSPILGQSSFEILHLQCVPTLYDDRFGTASNGFGLVQHVLKGTFDPNLSFKGLEAKDTKSKSLPEFGVRLNWNENFVFYDVRICTKNILDIWGDSHCDVQFVLLPVEPVDLLRCFEGLQMPTGLTTVHTVGDEYKTRKLRIKSDLSLLVMPDGKLEELMRDVESFLAPETKEYYSERGLSYKRGYLFTGPPGTGKTSTARMLAAKYNLDLLVFLLSSGKVSISTMRDRIEKLTHGKARGVVVLFEDFDCIADATNEMRVTNGGNPSFQDYLNLFDGIDTDFEIPFLFVVTANHGEKFDKALTRPGRIDYRLEFANLLPKHAGRLFRKFVPPAQHTPELEKLFVDNVRKNLGGKPFCPATLQGFLLMQRNQMKSVESWCDAVLHADLSVELTSHKRGLENIS